MLRSMFAAIGGLKNHQVMMDVTANNIANVNTVGYKAQRTAFAAMLTQTLRGASAPTAPASAARTRRRSVSASASRHPERAHAGLAADHGRMERHGDPGRRLLHRHAQPADRDARRRDVHARRQLHGRHQRRHRHALGPVRHGLDAGLRRPAADVQRRPRRDQHPGHGPGRLDRRGRHGQLRRRLGRAADRGPRRDRQVPEPGRPDAARRQPVRDVAEQRHVRPDELQQLRLRRRASPRGARRARTAAARCSRARSRCRTSTWPRSSPR